MHSCMSHPQTAQEYFFDFLKGPDPSYIVLKFSNNLPSRNCDMAQSVILYICDLERSIIIIVSALLRKLWPKTSFCIMVANITRSRISHVQTAQDVF